MKRPLFKLILILGIVYTGGHLAYLFFPLNDPLASPNRSATSNESPPEHGDGEPNLDSTTEVGSEIFKNFEFQPPTNLAESNELLATFNDSSSYGRFIENAGSAGIEIIGRNDSLRALRLRVENLDEANRIRGMAGDDAAYDHNFLVSPPLIPQPSTRSGPDAPFLDGALHWLGVPEENGDWGQGITIALLDTGVSSHRALDSSSISQIGLIADENTESSEYQGHGTAIASLLVGDTGIGIAPSAELLSIQVMDSDGLGDSFTLAEGILQAVDSGANIISMSLGSYGYTSVLENAVDYAVANNVILVASAGNDGINATPYPARFDDVIGVAAIDAENQRAEFSNYSPSIDVAAPGVEILAAWSEEEWIRFSGTSAAVPFVAGGIAATMSLDKQLSPQEAVETILTYSDDTAAPGKDLETGAGSLNMDRVLNRDERGIFDAAVGALYLDTQNATETTTPLQVTVQNRGTEYLPNVSILLSQNDGYPQRVYLGPLRVHETTSYTLYLDNSQLALEPGYAVDAATQLNGRQDSRPENDAKSGTLRIVSSDP